MILITIWFFISLKIQNGRRYVVMMPYSRVNLQLNPPKLLQKFFFLRIPVIFDVQNNILKI